MNDKVPRKNSKRILMTCDKCGRVQSRYPNARRCYDDKGRICGRLRHDGGLSARAGTPTEAQDLRCGDVFLFRGNAYLALSCFTDRRHSQSIITSARRSRQSDVHALRLFRTFRVEVVGHLDSVTLTRVDNTREELLGLPDPEMEK